MNMGTRTTDPSKRVILLVEDSRADVELTLRAFKLNNITNEVVVAEDGVEALDYLFGTGEHAGRDTTVMPQVILLDLKLPRMDGLECLKRIRADLRTKLVPVVVLTSSLQEEDLVKAYTLGANSFVQKPVDFVKFSEATKQLGLYWLQLNQGPPSHKA